MSKKQTAIQGLISELEQFANLPMIDKPTIELAIKFAKLRISMEKQQIIQAFYDSMGTNFDPNMGRAEQYYNETFKPE